VHIPTPFWPETQFPESQRVYPENTRVYAAEASDVLDAMDSPADDLHLDKLKREAHEFQFATYTKAACYSFMMSEQGAINKTSFDIFGALHNMPSDIFMGSHFNLP